MEKRLQLRVGQDPSQPPLGLAPFDDLIESRGNRRNSSFEALLARKANFGVQRCRLLLNHGDVSKRLPKVKGPVKPPANCLLIPSHYCLGEQLAEFGLFGLCRRNELEDHLGLAAKMEIESLSACASGGSDLIDACCGESSANEGRLGRLEKCGPGRPPMRLAHGRQRSRLLRSQLTDSNRESVCAPSTISVESMFER